MITIIGYGAMAKAIIEGLVASKEKVEVVGRNEEKLRQIAHLYHVQTALLEDFDIEGKSVILAVKPYALEEVAKQLRGKAQKLFSILAGTPIERLRRIPSTHYVRAMPNIAASKKASMTSLCGDEAIRDEAMAIFSKIGDVLWLQSERELDIATAIAGSGPAFLALVAEAMMDGGVGAGLKRQDAIALTRGLFKSFAALEDEHPAIIKDKVMSPAGTTAAGYQALEKNAVRHAFFEAVLKAFEKTQR